MELVIRKYFWAVNLCFVALVALLAAKTVNLFFEAAIAPAPSASAGRSTTRVAQTEAPAALDVAKLAQLTNLPLPSPETEEDSPRPDMSAEPVRTSLRLKLLGTLVSTAPGWSIGSILDLNNQKSSTVMVGDRVQNAEVLTIERDRVIIANNGRREYIGAEPGDGAPSPPPIATTRPVAEPAGGNQPYGAGIKALDDSNYEVPRNEVDRALANLNELAMQARIVPAFKDGQAEGFKLFSIRPDSLYSKIGIVNGDVIKRINGFEMNSPEKALEVYTKLKDANRIDIELDRNGQTLRKTYNVR
ncbi:MAG TPA: type II secretion system protein GspC [Myxococcaceae bacterium]|nr:type II secretion system protein GspC [Myxococcaceae bacterium]